MTDQLDSYEGPTGDSALVRFLYPPPAERRAGKIIGWWERRRIAYNVIVGGSGLATIAIWSLVHGVPPGVGNAVLATGLFANVAYTLGSLVEIATTKLWGRRVLPVGPALWRQGIMLSVGITFVIPMIIMTIGAIANVIGWFLT